MELHNFSTKIIIYFFTVPKQPPRIKNHIDSTQSKILYVTNVQKLNLRECPGQKCNAIAKLKINDMVIPLGENTDIDGEVWEKVDTNSGQGWVNKKYLNKQKVQENSNENVIIQNTTTAEHENKIESEIYAIATLVKQGDYEQADRKESLFTMKYPYISTEQIPHVAENVFYEARNKILRYRADKSQGLSQLTKNLLPIRGVIIEKSSQEGTGVFWDFVIKADNGIEYNFLCSNYNALLFMIDNKTIDSYEGYEQLKNKYKTATLYIPDSKAAYVLNRCKDQGCDGTCPSIIAMHSINTSYQ